MSGMQPVSFLFSPSGRLRPPAFVYGALALYLAGAGSHLLTTPDIIRRAGLWPFVAAQALLVWIWFVLHAKRLHEAGRGSGLAVGVGVLYALSVVLLMFIADSFFNTTGGLMGNAGASGALELILLLYVIVTLIGSPHYDLAWLMVVALMLIGFVPLVVALVFTVWTARRPSREWVSQQLGSRE
ncbi:MAG: hypothetical protein WBD53_08395 [Xanthobacteraceae bacterium]